MLRSGHMRERLKSLQLPSVGGCSVSVSFRTGYSGLPVAWSDSCYLRHQPVSLISLLPVSYSFLASGRDIFPEPNPPARCTRSP